MRRGRLDHWRQAAGRTERRIANVLAGVLVAALYAWFAHCLIEAVKLAGM
jgi:hypothetical protein